MHVLAARLGEDIPDAVAVTMDVRPIRRTFPVARRATLVLEHFFVAEMRNGGHVLVENPPRLCIGHVGGRRHDAKRQQEA